MFKIAHSITGGRSFGCRLTARFIALAFVGLLLGESKSLAQNIATVVAPGGSVDILNSSGNRWYFFSAPTPSGASMARVSSDLVSVYTWPDVANFTADPGTYSRDRIFQGEYLRVYAGSLPINTVITIPFSTPNPLSGNYTFTITVANAPYVTAINITDPSPTVAATVHWAVTFSAAISGVTAANFTLTNPNGLSGATITSVTGSGANWTVTATTGNGTGLLGCSYVGHASESPIVPATFTGQQYTFSPYPLITTSPGDTNIVAGSSCTLTAAATLRGGGAINFQWYLGTSVNPGAATLIGGATSASYVVSGVLVGSPRQYFCRAISAANTAYTADSTTATVTAFTPVAIGTQPSGTTLASGQTTTLSVSATGTAPHYQWYLGNAGDTSNPVGTDSASFTTPALSANTSYWVLVYNGLPAAYNKNSSTATVRVATSLTGNGPLAALVNDSFIPAPAFTVRDSAGVIITGFPVTLTVNGNSASGNFGGLASRTVNSDGSGIASYAFTANGTAGTYTIVATVGSVVSNSIAVRNLAQLLVTTAADEDNGSIEPTLGSGLSLREAVHYAVSRGGVQTISFTNRLAGQAIAINNGWSGGGDTSALAVSGVNLTLIGANNSLNLGGTTRRHFSVNSDATLLLNNLTLAGGYSSSDGGSVLNSGTLTVLNSTFSGNAAAAGVGGAISSGGPLTISNVLFSANSAYLGGAINSAGTLSISDTTFSGNVAGFNGGALRLFNNAAITRATFSNNQATNGGGGLINHGNLALTNCTFAYNTAATGGGLEAFAGTVNAVHITSSFNYASSSGGGLQVDSAVVTALNCLVAGNGAPSGANVVGTLAAGSAGNLLNLSTSAARLGSFAYQGGATATVALLAGSKAIGGGTAIAGITADQRGVARDPYPDIGAYEYVYPLVIPAANQVSVQPIYGPNYRLIYKTSAGISCVLQRTFDLNSPISWISIVTNTAAGDGTASFITASTPGTNTFWRVKLP